MNLLVTGAFAWTEDELNKVRQLGHNVIFMQQEKSELPCNASWVEGIIGNGIFLSHPIEEFVNLKYIQLTSAGYDRVSVNYVKEHNIQIFNARGVYSIPMAEYAVCGVLELYKQNRFFSENQRTHQWIKYRGMKELYGKTVCIVGCGNVGTECAKRFKSFGCVLIGVDIYSYTSEHYEKMMSLEDLDTAIETSDVVVLTLPLTAQTRNLMNTERFKKMKKNAVLISIARGAVVDTNALIEALKEKLFGAVMDVFAEEPLHEDSPLWDMENVIITPHNSFIGDGNHERMLDVIYRNLEAVK